VSYGAVYYKVITMDWNRDGEVDTSELRLTGLILAQSAMVGLAVGVFDSGVWLPAGASGDSWMNGMTYAMGALAVQMLGFYIFKMFFEQSMQQRVYQQNRQREYEMRLRGMQSDHEQRRMELELRIQEMQLQKDLAVFQNNPQAMENFLSQQNQNNIPPTVPQSGGSMSLGLDTLTQQNVTPPRNLDAVSEQAYNHAINNYVPTPEELNALANDLEKEPNVRLKKDGTPDLRYKKK